MYDTLFSEIEIGSHTVKNRIVFCGPATGFAKDGRLTTQLAAYYLERAKGGAGLIELEPDLAFQEHCINEWKEFAEHVHAYGTKLVAAFEIPYVKVNETDKDICQNIMNLVELIHGAGFDGISLYTEKASQDFCLDIIQSISKLCGNDFIIGVHLPSCDVEGDVIEGFPQDSGVSYLVIPCEDGYGDFSTFIPVVKSVSSTEPESCEKLLKNDSRSMVALSWPLICDPYWPVKAELGREKEIRKHSFNPYLGNESRYSENNMSPAAKLKNVVIVGGGPAGMQAAITASLRGHNVFLLEKQNELGGKLKSQNLTKEADWFVGELKRNQVDVRLGIPVTVEHIAILKPDIVIMAVDDSSTEKTMISSLHKKGIQVVDINRRDCSIDQAIRSGFYVAIGI